MRLANVLVGMSLAACIADATRLQAGVVYTNQSSSSTAWNGLGADFQPNWVGETTTVEVTPQNQDAINGLFGTGTLGTIAGSWAIIRGGGPLREQRWTVNKTSSFAEATTQSVAKYKLAGENHTASSGNTVSGVNSTSANLAHYAEIVTSDNRLLANASAIACQNANFRGQSFTASGLVSANSLLTRGAKSSLSKAEGSSRFTASYNLQKDTPFSLSLDMGAFQDVDLAFSAIDNHTGETLWDLAPSQSGRLQHLEWSGVLGAGDYTFALNAMADSMFNQNGLQDLAGQAMYNVSLDFQAESYWVDFGTLHYASDSGRLGCVVDGSTIGLSPSVRFLTLSGGNGTYAVVPEPCGLVLLLAGLLALGFCRRAGILPRP